MKPGRFRVRGASSCALLLCCTLLACESEESRRSEQSAPSAPSEDAPSPNILWVVWDTVRADHMSLYGYTRPTTPKLDAWSKQARVFDNVVSTASSTVPSHAAMFTGLLPSEHGANNGHRWLDNGHFTLAERLGKVGYQTFLWSANPHISRAENFQQGFDFERHPWDPQSLEKAIRIVQKKSAGDRSAGGGRPLSGGKSSRWGTKAAGELAEDSLLRWLSRRDAERPWFAFINYMEAHRPFIPAREARLKMMSKEDTNRSYKIDRSWAPMWKYVFGLRDYTPKELEIMAATYDATLSELDLLFANLLEGLEERGLLENTVILLTADHGEHLGEHHLLDHQYSLYRPLINVPLVIHYPPRFAPGRDPSPVVNFDLFPTVLELAGADSEDEVEQASKARSLLRTTESRQRMSEYPVVFTAPFRVVRKKHPTWNSTPWRSRLYALQEGRFKIICGKASGPELYDVEEDPGEEQNRRNTDPDRLLAMGDALNAFLASTRPYQAADGEEVEWTPEHREHLEALGYLLGDEESDATPEVQGSVNPCAPF